MDFGEIIIVTEEVISCKQIAEIQFRAENLPKSSWLSGIDPFLVILRSNEGNVLLFYLRILFIYK